MHQIERAASAKMFGSPRVVIWTGIVLAVLSGCRGKDSDQGEAAALSAAPVHGAIVGTAEQIAVDTTVARRVQQFFEDFTAAMQGRTAERFEPFFDARETLRLLREHQWIAAPRANEDRLVEMLEGQMSRQFNSMDAGIRWERYEILTVQSLDGSDRVVVNTRLYDSSDRPKWMRWWLSKEGRRWLAYDYRVDNYLLPFSALQGVRFKMGDIDDPAAMKALPMIEAVQLATAGEIQPALAKLVELEGAGLTDNLESLRLALQAWAQWQLGMQDYACETAEQGIARDPDSATLQQIAGHCSAARGDYSEALQHAERYANLAGRDAAYFGIVGDIHAGMGRLAQARQEYRTGLSSDSHCEACLYGLARLASASERSELVEHFRLMDEPQSVTGALAERAEREGDAEVLARLIEIYDRAGVDGEKLPLYQGILNELRQNPRPAESARPVESTETP